MKSSCHAKSGVLLIVLGGVTRLFLAFLYENINFYFKKPKKCLVTPPRTIGSTPDLGWQLDFMSKA